MNPIFFYDYSLSHIVVTRVFYFIDLVPTAWEPDSQ
jgi:hypothetical protein